MKHLIMSLVGGLVGAAVALVPAIFVYGQQVRQIEVNTKRLDKLEAVYETLRDKDSQLSERVAKCCIGEKSGYSLMKEADNGH